MTLAALGDRLVSFGGYVFTPDQTTRVRYTRSRRVPLRRLPGSDYAVCLSGTTAPLVAVVELEVDYHLQAATNASLKAALASMRAQLAAAGQGALVMGNRDLSPVAVTARFVDISPVLLPDSLYQVPVTLHFKLLADAAASTLTLLSPADGTTL